MAVVSLPAEAGGGGASDRAGCVEREGKGGLAIGWSCGEVFSLVSVAGGLLLG